MISIQIHQIWLQGRAAIPADILQSMQSWVDAARARDTFEYVFWDEASIQKLLHLGSFSRIKRIYESVPENLYGMRTDIARLVILFQFGGVYADADTRVLNSGSLLDYFENALLRDRGGVVVGTADLCGMTRRWIEATRTPSNFLLACRSRSGFIETYLNSIASDFDAFEIADKLCKADVWSRTKHLRLTKGWTGPRKLRALLESEQGEGDRIRLTPVGFVASGYQRSFSDAALAHDYKANWYQKSKLWKSVRNGIVYSFLSLPLDAVIIVLILLLVSVLLGD